MIEVLDSLITEYKENVQQCLEKIQPLADVLQPPITSVDFEQAEEISKLFPPSDTVDPACLEAEFEIFPQVVDRSQVPFMMSVIWHMNTSRSSLPFLKYLSFCLLPQSAWQKMRGRSAR